jgi:hypothetical protein
MYCCVKQGAIANIEAAAASGREKWAVQSLRHISHCSPLALQAVYQQVTRTVCIILSYIIANTTYAVSAISHTAATVAAMSSAAIISASFAVSTSRQVARKHYCGTMRLYATRSDLINFRSV